MLSVNETELKSRFYRLLFVCFSDHSSVVGILLTLGWPCCALFQTVLPVPTPPPAVMRRSFFFFSVNIKLSSPPAPGKAASCGNLPRHHSCIASVVPSLEQVPAVSLRSKGSC